MHDENVKATKPNPIGAFFYSIPAGIYKLIAIEPELWEHSRNKHPVLFKRADAAFAFIEKFGWPILAFAVATSILMTILT